MNMQFGKRNSHPIHSQPPELRSLTSAFIPAKGASIRSKGTHPAIQ